MTSCVSASVAAVVAALQAAPAVASQVARVRLRPWSEATATAVAVLPVSAERVEAQWGYSGPDVWAVRIGVECYARAPAGTAPDVAVDAVIQAVYARLMADPTLAGAIPGGLEPQGLTYDFDADGEQTAAGVLQFIGRVTSGPTFA